MEPVHEEPHKDLAEQDEQGNSEATIDEEAQAILPAQPEPEVACADPEPLAEALDEKPIADHATGAPSERRCSKRLSNAHLLREEAQLARPSSLKQCTTACKENSAPQYNRNISHIPTLKERVNSLASKPGIKRSDASTTRASAPSKAKFDLKASLKRPLGYKPYTGPVTKKLNMQ